MKTRVFTDTCSDLTFAQAEKIGVELIVLPVTFSGQPFHQGDAEDFPKFYEKMATAEELPVTSQPVFGDLVNLFREIADAGDQGVYLTITDGISGTYASALKAKELVGYDGIEIVNSKQTLSAVALQAIRLGEDARKGWSAKEIADDMNEFRLRTNICHNVTDLTNLKKGGRIPSGLAAFGNLFHIVPFLWIDDEGRLASPVRDRSLKKSMKRMVSYTIKYEVDLNYPILVQYSSIPSRGEELMAMFQEAIPEARLVMMPTGPVVGTHVGFGTVGAASVFTEAGYKQRMEDMAKDPKCIFQV